MEAAGIYRVKSKEGEMKLLALIFIIPFLTATACTKPDSQKSAITGTDEKIEFYKHKIEIDPVSYAYHNRLAQSYIQKARETGDISYYRKAQALLKESLRLSPSNYVGLVYMAIAKGSEHDFARALEYAKQATGLYPKRSYAYGVIGDAYLELGQIENARLAYEKMIELDPGLDSYSRLSNLRLKQHDTIGAVSAMEKAYESGLRDVRTSKENLAWTQAMLGKIYLDQGDEHRAQEYFESALEILPGYFLAHKHLEESHDHSHSF